MGEQRPLDPTPSRGTVDGDGYYRPSGYEILTCWVTGFDPVDELAAGPLAPSPRAGFEAALLPALRRTPCVVAFSGGRDSSAILAVATHLARRHGLPDPVPATHDFTGRGEADESHYQELLIRELGLREWHRFRDEDGRGFDVLGERARRGLRRHGLLWPAMVHCHAPLVELAAGGGSVITGEGGDEVLGSQRMAAVNYVIKNRHRPGRRTLRLLADSLAPATWRRRELCRQLRATPMHPWLRPEIAEGFVQRLARDLAGAPLRWDAAVLRCAGRRSVTTAAANFRRIFAADDVTYHEPFLDPAFLAPLRRAGGWRGWITRTSMMRMLFGDVLPEEICGRDQKARFGSVAVGGPSREFIADWNGEGADPDVVDIEAFRAAVNGESPVYGVQLLLQSAWLAVNRDRGETAVADARRT
ncbi:MAG TPA: asparagine synthase-related protein [Pseudonocardiaceae bacterium]|nr:asparagine synthase-related protein [Pseudonocardiaceae bacterium]